MKKKVYFYLLLIVFMGVNLLSSCRNDAPTDRDNITESTVGDKEEEKKAPVFQGILIKKMDSIQLNCLDTAGSVITRDNSEKGNEHDNGWHGRNPNKNGNDDDDFLPEDYDTLEYNQDIEKLVDLDVIIDDEIRYYVQAGEEFLVLIKLKNPSNYEIQSFTLNGKKYSNYMFEDGSDMENLYLKVKAPKEGGYTEYSIDSIKYIDGTEIKDVDLSSGNKSIKAGVKYENEPQINVTNLDAGINEVSFNLYLTDIDNLITEDVVLYVSDGEEIVGQRNLKDGNNYISFGSLRIDNPYQYLVVAKYDACDGKELCNHILYKGNFATKALMSFKDINISNQSVSFGVEAINDSVVLTYAGVFDKENENRVVKFIEVFNDLSFDGLKSNHPYILYAEYTFLVEGESYIGYIYYDFNTEEIEEPKLDINFTSTKDKIQAKLVTIDMDNILSIDRIEVYNNHTFVALITDFDNIFADGLTPNTIYTFKVYYSYDLNDGKGVKNETYQENYSTLADDVKVDSFIILNENFIKTGDIINVRVNLDNKSNIIIDSISMNDEKIEIVGGDYSSYIILAIKAPSMSGNFTISISKFEYTLNGILIEQNIDEAKITIPVASRLNVVNISTFDGSDIVNSKNPAGTVITVDNPDGYEVVECTIITHGDQEHKYEARMIDNNHFYISLNNDSSGSQCYQMESITYLVNGERVVRYYDDTFSVSATYITPSESYGIDIKKISTPEDLLNIESGNSYEIVNDIDMTGYKWNVKDFDGYINGNGHTVANISIIIENEYRCPQYCSLFGYLRGTIKNVFFKNVYYGIQSQGFFTCDVLAISLVAETPGVFVSGSINIDTSSYEITNDCHVKIVDHYYVNTQKFFESNTITNERFESEEYRDEIGWIFVEKQINEYNGFEYKIIDNSYIFIDSYNGSESILSIPSEINGLPVCGISDFAFANNKNIVDITIPKEIIFVGGECLNGCSNIEKISFGNYNLVYLFDAIEYKKSLKGLKEITITIPEGITSIDSCAFQNCSQLTSIVIPEGITSIGSCAFQSCSQLTSVIIPEGVESIGDNAFDGCGLSVVVLPKSVNALGVQVFNSPDIYYAGSTDDWQKVEENIDYTAGKPFNGTLYYYSEEEPTDSGNYWHYVEGLPVKWE